MDEKSKLVSTAAKVSTLGGCFAGALAGCEAVTFTNPIEVVKTRMQLQGELSTVKTPKIYKNPVQALWLICKNEGLRGAQKGLLPSYLYQIGLNSTRIGLYEPVRRSFNTVFYPKLEPDQVKNVAIDVLAAMTTGVIGAIISSPIYLVKTRMQSFSDKVKIGEQTHYKSTWSGLTQIYHQEGPSGLFRGVDAAILRTAAGSAAQLPLYNFSKNELVKTGYFDDAKTALQMTCALVAGFGVAIVMNPFDVVLTRVYNQKGDLYSGPVDCILKTVKTEGFFALYKGFVAQLLRNAPHTMLLLTFMEHSMTMVYKFENGFKEQ